MAASPWARGTLYRNLRLCVILWVVTLLAATMPAQSPAGRAKADKGPRALGLVQLAPNGKAYLIPIVIMYDGEFYDASAYKAAPVPMALESGIVYEGERSGASQGLFTVHGALEGPNNTWKAEGNWLPEGSRPKNAPHKAETTPRDMEREEGPPVLRRRETKEDKPAQPPAEAPVPVSSPAPAAAPPQPPPAPAPTVPAPAPAEPDRNQPVLRRGKPAPAPPEPLDAPATASAKPSLAVHSSGSAKATNPAAQFVTFPAISDAGGPEPRPYVYTAKPEEEALLRKKILAMAADEVRARAQQRASETIGDGSPKTTGAVSAKRKIQAPQPEFDDVQMRLFDLSFSNEPVVVLMAKARMPQKGKTGVPELPYLLTLVAHEDIYGDLHKAFSNITDAQHLDVIPQMDFIDAVDVDGDGRGELLFRRTSDVGSAYSVYRVIGNQVWPLFEGTIGE